MRFLSSNYPSMMSSSKLLDGEKNIDEADASRSASTTERSTSLEKADIAPVAMSLLSAVVGLEATSSSRSKVGQGVSKESQSNKCHNDEPRETHGSKNARAELTAVTNVLRSLEGIDMEKLRKFTAMRPSPSDMKKLAFPKDSCLEEKGWLRTMTVSELQYKTMKYIEMCKGIQEEHEARAKYKAPRKQTEQVVSECDEVRFTMEQLVKEAEMLKNVASKREKKIERLKKVDSATSKERDDLKREAQKE